MFAPPTMTAPLPSMPVGPAFVPPRRSAPAVAAVPASPPRRQPVIRAQAPEEPKPARPPMLTLPPPEQLGVAVRPTDRADADWTALHARMRDLGVLSFRMDKLPNGRARFTCWMPLDRPELTRRIECEAASEWEAAQRGLREAAGMSRPTP